MRLFPLVAVLALAVPAAAQCPVTAISTSDYGKGTGVFTPTTLLVAFDATNCTLEIKLDHFACCNTFLQQHVAFFGASQLQPPTPLPSPWVMGSELLVSPDLVLPSVFAASQSIPIPPNPAIVGKTTEMQVVPIFFTTIGLAHDLAVTQGTTIKFG